MGGKYFVVGTFFGIQLRIDYSWFIIFVLIAWTVIVSYLPAYYPRLSPLAVATAGLVVTILFFASVIAHEYAHSIVANRRGLRIKRITLFIFGGASELQHEPKSAKTELLMTVAGPLTSLVIAGVFGGIWLLARHWHLTALAVVCRPVATLNFVVAVFNLLPAFPLDGGRILRSLIWLRRKDFTSATKSATNAGITLSYLLIALGVLEVLAGNLIGGFWLAIIGFFLNQSARLSYNQVLNQDILANVKVRDVLSDQYVTVPLGTSVQDFLSNFVLRYKQYDFLMTDKANKPTGIIEWPRAARRIEPQKLIDSYAHALTKDLLLKPSDQASKALRIMQFHNLGILPVMSDAKLVGVVARKYLEDYVLLHRLQQ